jgi:hypothetical protein
MKARSVLVALASVTAVLWWAPAALAGGPNIASAPQVAYGQRDFGNTVTDNGRSSGEPGFDYLDAGCGDGDSSWWTLSVIAGDQVTINFEGRATTALAFPVGTNDYNVTNTEAYAHVDSQGQKRSCPSTAPQTGSMPLDFYDCSGPEYGFPSPGPYDFVAYVRHRLNPYIGWRPYRAQHKTHFTLTGYLLNGQEVFEGLTCTVQQRWSGIWHTLGAVSGLPCHGTSSGAAPGAPRCYG